VELQINQHLHRRIYHQATGWSIVDLAWSRFGVMLVELSGIAENLEAFRVLLGPLHPRTPQKKIGRKNESMNAYVTTFFHTHISKKGKF